jgi:iron(III) transport system permease protein
MRGNTGTMSAAPLTMPKAPSRIDGATLFLFAAVALLLALVALPIGWLVFYAFSDDSGRLSLSSLFALAADTALLAPFATTFVLALSVAVASVMVATPLAWLVARTDMPWRRSVRALMTASFVTPPFLGAIAWEILAAPNSGILNRWWRDLSGSDDPLFNVYSLPGLIFVIACYTTPYVFVLIANALDRIPSEFEDAAHIHGAPSGHALRTVTFPLVLPAILAGALIAFLQAMILFGSPAILALPAGFHTVTTKIFQLFQFPPKLHLAAAAALPLLLATILLLRIQARALGRRGFSVVGGKGGAARLHELGRWRYPVLALSLAALAMPIFLPYAALLKAAITRIPSDALSLETMTSRHMRFVFFEFSQTWPAFWNTFALAISAATLGALLALVIAYLVARRAAGSRVLEFMATAPIAVPGIVLGVGLYLAYTRPPFQLYGTLWILLLAFLTIELPAAYHQMRAAFQSIGPELEEASRILGGSRLVTLRRITAPLLKTSVAAAWCFVFIGVVRELSAAIMLFTANTKVLSVVIYDLNETGELGAIAVLGIAMLVVTFLVVGAANRLTGAGAAMRLRSG